MTAQSNMSRSAQPGTLKLSGVTKRFGNTEVLKGIDLEVKAGEFVVFVGPSGCGKSTLLRIIAGLEEASSGGVAIDGATINALPPAKRGIAMVFQTYALYPHLTVRDNMALGLKQARVPRDIIDAQVSRATDMLSLAPYLERRPAQLSGGQRQRVAIGRAVVREPKLFLFDEPLSNLDAALRVNTRLEIAKLHRDLSATMIYVTHDQIEAMTLADRIVVMNEGRIEQVGSPMELYREPANRFVAGFIGSPQMNFTAGEHLGQAAGTTVGIRPEHLTLSADGGIAGTVVHVERLGADSNVYVETEGAGPLLARVFGDCTYNAGDRVSLSLDNSKAHLFDASGKCIKRGI